MHKVMQTVLGPDPPGDCFQASLASILELPLDGVPNRDAKDWADYMLEVFEFLNTLDLFMLEVAWEDIRVNSANFMGFPSYWIDGGTTRRGTQHSVVMEQDSLAHDPHPSKGGLVEVLWATYLVPLDPAKGIR